MLLVGASTFAVAQTPAEQAAQARERVKALIKSGETDISKLLPKHESDDDEDSAIDPLAGKSEDEIRGYNDSRRKAYAEQKEAFTKAGIDFSKTAMGKLKQDSVGIYANIGGNLVAMKHIDADENRVTDTTFGSKWILTQL